MPDIQRITTLDDPRIQSYRNLRERTLRGESIFLGEALLLVERMLRSRYPVQSILASEKFLDELPDNLPDDIPVYVGEKPLLRELVGYQFHRGIMAIGRRLPELSLDHFVEAVGLEAVPNSAQQELRPCEPPARQCIVVAPKVSGPDNLGMIFRSAAALGVRGVVLGHESNDPLSRRALRLSMGATLTIPYIRPGCEGVESFDDILHRLRGELRFETVGAVLSERAVPLDRFQWPQRTALMMGNEFEGLSDSQIAQCDHLVTIPMRAGTDSLNLGVSTGIFLYDCMYTDRV